MIIPYAKTIMDGGKLEDLGMCLETSYPEIFFDGRIQPGLCPADRV